MNAPFAQLILRPEQLRAFSHDIFVAEQVRDFAAICPIREGRLVDMGGGCGHFSRALADVFPGIHPCVVDLDAAAVALCQASGIEAARDDALYFDPAADQRLATFNLVLHHLVAGTDERTGRLQRRALRNWWQAEAVFVNEYVYDSHFGDIGARLIYAVTSSRRLAPLCRWLARRFPALRANTAGTGVRFRSRDSWERLFRRAGFHIEMSTRGTEERIAWPLRLLVRSIRRDSFLLRAGN